MFGPKKEYPNYFFKLKILFRYVKSVIKHLNNNNKELVTNFFSKMHNFEWNQKTAYKAQEAPKLFQGNETSEFTFSKKKFFIKVKF